MTSWTYLAPADVDEEEWLRSGCIVERTTDEMLTEHGGFYGRSPFTPKVVGTAAYRAWEEAEPRPQNRSSP